MRALAGESWIIVMFCTIVAIYMVSFMRRLHPKCENSTEMLFVSTHSGMVVVLCLESVARHAALVLLDRTLAVLLRIVALREQHAVVARGFLVFADAARLVVIVSMDWRGEGKGSDLDFGGCFTRRLEVGCEVRGRRRSCVGGVPCQRVCSQ